MKLLDDQDDTEEVGEGGTTLEVRNIPENMKEDYLQMYFESAISGGCAKCVKDVTVVKPGTAHVQLTDGASESSINLIRK